jgi:hypothetical protein
VSVKAREDQSRRVGNNLGDSSHSRLSERLCGRGGFSSHFDDRFTSLGT